MPNEPHSPSRSGFRDPLFLVALIGGSLPALVWALQHGRIGLTREAFLTWTFFSLTVWQPLLEELVFRGLLQPELLRRPLFARTWLRVSLANLATSAAFVALHLIHHSPLWAAAVFVPSLIFGLFRERHGSWLSPFILHSIYNVYWFTAAGVPSP